jgi:thiol:disulfide interchange protein DsbC
MMAALALSWFGAAIAAEQPAPAAVTTAIRQAIETSRPDLKVKSVAVSAMPGLYAVQIGDGPVVYATADGRHFVLGDLFEVKPTGFVNLAEQQRDGERAKLIAGVKPADMIIFKPKGATKAVINVFTDVDCFYCQKLHQEVPALNQMGIEVRYLAWPRSGLTGETYNKMVTAWCAKDRQQTLTQLKSRAPVPLKSCTPNPVAAQYQLGVKMGLNGTPAMITQSGTLLPGYMPAADLAHALGVK